MKKEQLIENPLNCRPHIVLLGSGASRAAFPQGDLHGKILPTMSDLIDTIDLFPLLKGIKIDSEKLTNFELLYSDLSSKPEHGHLLKKLENKVYNYFSALKLPSTATHYDRLLLSLRKKRCCIYF